MRRVRLSNGFVAWVDDEDFETVSKHKWCLSKKGKNYYAVTNVPVGKYKQKTLYMHHLILPPVKGKIVDHVDRNGLNNRRRNLRHALWGENIVNSRMRVPKSSRGSSFRGVYREPGNGWYAAIRKEGKLVYLGLFDCEEDAARAFDAAAFELRGDFTSLNFPKEVVNG